MTSPIPTGQENQVQGSTIPVQGSGPGTPAGAANLLASLPDEHYNTLALAVFFKLEGSQYLGHMITENSVNPITFLPMRHAQVQLTWPEERVVNVGARVGGLSPSIGGVFAEEGEAMILTAMGYPLHKGKIVSPGDHEKRRERHADALRVVYKLGDWQSLGRVTHGGESKNTRLPIQSTIVQLTWDAAPVKIGDRVSNLINRSNGAKVSASEEAVLRIRGHAVDELERKLLPGPRTPREIDTGTHAQPGAHPVAAASGSLQSRRTKAAAHMAEPGPAASPLLYQAGWAAGPSQPLAVPWTYQAHHASGQPTYAPGQRSAPQQNTPVPGPTHYTGYSSLALAAGPYLNRKHLEAAHGQNETTARAASVQAVAGTPHPQPKQNPEETDPVHQTRTSTPTNRQAR
ncbi:hypothetical protein ACH4C6_36240 [Streptomyces sp. NPDC017943]|uniref:hypothetical protein n=1 Tax=Streptomyces sp. NPDC017943 TaxID=3365019 RepID=UPI003787B7D5